MTLDASTGEVYNPRRKRTAAHGRRNAKIGGLTPEQARKKRGGGRARNPQGKLYEVVEIDAGDKRHVLRSGLTRKEALEKVKALKSAYGPSGLRYIARRANRHTAA